MTLYQDSADFACMFLSIDDGTTSNESYVSINPTSDNLSIVGGDTGAIGGINSTNNAVRKYIGCDL